MLLQNWRLTDGHLTAVRWLSVECPINVQWMSIECPTTVQQLFDNCKTTAWWLLTTDRRLSDDRYIGLYSCTKVSISTLCCILIGRCCMGLEARVIINSKWYWCGSTYMVVRLSNISSKTGKKCIFCVFRPFLSLCRTASQPGRLSHINALCINQSYKSKDQSMKFLRH